MIGGHSWSFGRDWIQEIYDAEKITNLSLPGAGNRFISDSVISHLSRESTVDKVLVCGSGLNRIDIPLPKKLRPNWQSDSFQGETEDAIYHTNHMAPWRDKDVKIPIDTELVRMMYQEKDYRSVKAQSLIGLLNLQNFLKIKDMDYRFCFMYDYTNKDFDHNHLTGEGHDGYSTMGTVDKDNVYLAQIDQSRVLMPYGIDWAMKQKEDLFQDSIHLTDDGYRKWARELLKSYHRWHNI